MSAVEPIEPGQVPAPIEGQEPGTPPQEGTPPAGPEPQGESAEIRALRQEAASTRRKLRESETELQRIRDADLSESERRDKALQEALAERDDLKSKVSAATLRADVVIAARRLDIVDPDAAFRLMDPVDPNADDYDEQLEASLAKLVEKRPYLKAAAPGEPGPTPTPQIPPSNPPKPRNATELTREDIKGMSRDQIEALDPAVLRAAMNRT